MKFISAEKNVQILVALLKEHGIRRIVASPGTTNLNFVVTLQSDDFFEVFSAVDERGAAYMAVGMAFESGEPVVITCTGATASRNYLPGLSEAYHRKLPVLAVTATQDPSKVGNLEPQVIDRSQHPADAVTLSISLPYIHDKTDAWRANLDVNRALLELRRRGGGPVHINLTTRYDNNTVSELPVQRVIRRYTPEDELPPLPQGRIAVTVGGHKLWDTETEQAIDCFCAANDAVVFVDHSSGFHGKYGCHATLAASQEYYKSPVFAVDLLIQIGEHSGDYYTMDQLNRAKEVWRVSPDGELRDTFRKLTKVFEMPEYAFFARYRSEETAPRDGFLRQCRAEQDRLSAMIPELPFSNIWLARTAAPRLPEGSVIHLGVSNTQRAWTFFDFPESVLSIANVGCRGIDGSLSTVLGMSLAQPDRLHFCVVGDLTFFYNMNALGNRHVGNNLRILLVNNGRGTEFRIFQHRAQKMLGDEADPYVAAAGHSGNKSPDLVRHYAQDLGFRYLSARDKREAEMALDVFLDPALMDKPMLFEAFTDSADENEALKLVRRLEKSASSAAKAMVKNLLGEKGVQAVKRLINR